MHANNMYKLFLALSLIFLSSQSTLAQSATPTDICVLSEAEQQHILSQPIEIFDANHELGWRLFWDRHCEELTVDLLHKYQTKNGKSSRVAFHEAQIKLSMGQFSGVRKLLFDALLPDMTNENPFRWNDYVLGYVAFLDNDAEALRYYLGRLQARPDVRGNAMNAIVLSKLLAGIGTKYSLIFPRP